jgi:hypothetical protein
MRIIIILLFCSSLILISCKENSLESTKLASLIPLTVGNQWIFKETYFSTENPFPYIDTLTITIFNSAIVSDQTWYNRKITSNKIFYDPVENYGWWSYSVTREGIYSCILYKNSMSTSILHYKHPSKVGDTYGSPFFFATNDNITFTNTFNITTVVLIDTQIVVPAGIFHCVQYRTSPHGDTTFSIFDEYISPNYGWIKSEYISKNYGLVSRYVREAVQINIKE